VQITPPANLQSLRLTSSCKDGAVAKYCHMELSVWLLPYQFFCLPCPLFVFHTQKAPSLFSFVFRTQLQTWPFKLLAPPSQAQWQKAQLYSLPCPLSLFHTHKAPINSEAHQIFKCLPNLLHKMWWDLFNPLQHGFPSFHNSTLDSKSRLGNLGV
jgi:hypothetical protein